MQQIPIIFFMGNYNPQSLSKNNLEIENTITIHSVIIEPTDEFSEDIYRI